jgi:hypothetical protein
MFSVSSAGLKGSAFVHKVENSATWSLTSVGQKGNFVLLYGRDVEINLINVAAGTHFLKIAELWKFIKHLKVGIEFEAICILQLDFLSIYNIICLLNK